MLQLGGFPFSTLGILCLLSLALGAWTGCFSWGASPSQRWASCACSLWLLEHGPDASVGGLPLLNVGHLVLALSGSWSMDRMLQLGGFPFSTLGILCLLSLALGAWTGCFSW